MSEPTVSELRFPAAPGSGQVSAILLKPPDCHALCVLGHGAGAGMRHRFMDGIAGALSSHGIATFRYQFPFTEAGKRRPDRAPVLTGTVRSAVAAARELEDPQAARTSNRMAHSAAPNSRLIISS